MPEKKECQKIGLMSKAWILMPKREAHIALRNFEVSF